MRKLIKLNMIQIITWSIVLMGVLFVFTRKGTIEQWGNNRLKTLFLSTLFLLGFGVDFITRIIEKSKKWGFSKDERDELVQSRAMNFGFITLILYIYILSIALYIFYETQKLMPVGWVWFIAYTSVAVASLSTNIASLYLYRKRGY